MSSGKVQLPAPRRLNTKRRPAGPYPTIGRSQRYSYHLLCAPVGAEAKCFLTYLLACKTHWRVHGAGSFGTVFKPGFDVAYAEKDENSHPFAHEWTDLAATFVAGFSGLVPCAAPSAT
jgi:hypothetical protein